MKDDVAAEDVAPAPIEGVYEIGMGTNIAYVSSDARYLLRGDIYDLDNNVVKMIDENDNSTSLVFDSRNRLVRTVNALDGVISLEYDRVNNLTAMSALGISPLGWS